jgi:hypothetical protein
LLLALNFALTITSLAAAVFSFIKATDDLGAVNGWAVLVFAGMMLFPILSIETGAARTRARDSPLGACLFAAGIAGVCR